MVAASGVEWRQSHGAFRSFDGLLALPQEGVHGTFEEPRHGIVGIDLDGQLEALRRYVEAPACAVPVISAALLAEFWSDESSGKALIGGQ